MRKGKKALTIVSLILFLGALVFVSYQLFQVRTVTVVGCETRAPDEIIALSGISYNTSIFLVDKQRVEDALSSDPRIKPIDVEITYPDTVTLSIEERHPMAYIVKEGAYIVIDDESWVLELLAEPPPTAYPQVTGLQADTVKVGAQIGTDDAFKIAVLKHVLHALTQTQTEVSEINLSYAVNISVRLSNGFTVKLGDDTGLEQKLKLASTVVNEMVNMGKTTGTVNVSSGKKAYYQEN